MKRKENADACVADYVGVGLQLQLLQPDALVSSGGFSPRLSKHLASSHANLLLIRELPPFFKKVIFGTEKA